MAITNRSPFAGEGSSGEARGRTVQEDRPPLSLPEDRSEGNLSPDPVLECGMCLDDKTESEREAYIHRGHSPGNEPPDDDGAGNVSPRQPPGEAYGQDDVDGLEMGPDWSRGSAG